MNQDSRAGRLEPCPICSNPRPHDPRYPLAVCPACVDRAVDEKGRLLRFFNATLSGGFVAVYADTGEQYTSHECFIDGVRCWADEAYMGGIVVVLDQQR